MDKEKEYTRAVLNEEYGWLTVWDKEGNQRTLDVITKEEDKEYLKGKYEQKALFFMSDALAAMFLPSALFGIYTITENISFSGLLFFIAVNLPLAFIFFYLLKIGACLLMSLFGIENHLRQEKRIKPFLIAFLAWVVIVLASQIEPGPY